MVAPPPRVERFHHPTLASIPDARHLPRWSRCEPRAASLETACPGAGSARRVVRTLIGERGLEASTIGWKVPE
ncbi:hypothetical protein GPOL_c47810 [Gordonia polyisoprenivorans VH2]|uniref:Uncharacterized protein n=1 Tax=Gordonia polyisoprenivorans (strain DSM 44266 / VH2) TaxID=1112204 RepID=H6N0C0_GORPV|nr:hypothetical protein GPOL_c47810 [Gordonia polyisoprenivorans VH2]